MKKIIKILFLVFNNANTQIIKFVFLSLFATILEVVSVGTIYPFINSIFYKNNNFITETLKLDLESKSIVIILCITIILVFLLKNIYSGFFIYWQNKFIQNIYKIISMNLLKNYLSKKYSFFYINNSTILINNVYIESKNFAFVVGSFIKFLSEIFIFIFMSIFLFFFQPYITLFLLIFFLVFSFFHKKFIKKFFNLWGQQRTQYTNLMLKELRVIFEGIKTIKIMNKENYFFQEFKRYIDNFSKSAVVHSTSSEFPKIFFEIISVTFISIFIIFNLESDSNSQNIIPILAVFVVAAFRLIPGFNRILVSYQNIVYSYTTINIIYNEVKEKLEQVQLDENYADTINFKKSIEISCLNFNYEGNNFNFFENLNLSIKKMIL